MSGLFVIQRRTEKDSDLIVQPDLPPTCLFPLCDNSCRYITIPEGKHCKSLNLSIGYWMCVNLKETAFPIPFTCFAKEDNKLFL